MDDLISDQRKTYDGFQRQLTSNVKPLFDELRDYCLSLGKNVIEDVRMHRIVFCKSMTFRYFADIEPQRDSVIIKIRRDRKESVKETEVKPNESLDEVKRLILDAYTNIH
ncbi:MAG: hypothetical protein E6K91_06950 [Thaumarchaeota archaeon]|nr:MAG: hypothetical protein E6K91_06950 [Nitrososphaerota archaeon]